MTDVKEFTIEVNPDDVSGHMLEVWKRGGVNRLSMGIQSFDDVVLKEIGRRHNSQTAIEAYKLARKAFNNISIDLMFGLPGQTAESWRMDLRKALELRPEHISAYSLMYEDGTALTALRDSGRITEASEDSVEYMFRMLIDELSKSGYDHYEISNFALPGFRSRHNSSYWLQKPYIGLGPSAHSYDGIRLRKGNKADIRGYNAYWSTYDGQSNIAKMCPVDMETLTDEELREEYVLTRMRMREGIPLADFNLRFGSDALRNLIEGSGNLVERGLINLSDSSISLTELAILLSDSVILELASCC